MVTHGAARNALKSASRSAAVKASSGTTTADAKCGPAQAESRRRSTNQATGLGAVQGWCHWGSWVTAAGYYCYRYLEARPRESTALVNFEPVNGGQDQACRGLSVSDNRESYFTVESSRSLQAPHPLCCCGIWALISGLLNQSLWGTQIQPKET